jgi:hypothetical protein
MTHTTEQHPAEQHTNDLDVARSRARWAMILLGITAAQRAVTIPVTLWQNGLIEALKRGEPPSQESLERSDQLIQLAGVAQLVLLVATGTLFLMWLHRTVKLTRALGGETLRWTPKDATWGFVIPFISFARPYQVMRDVHDHLAPDVLPEPPVEVKPGELSGYRGVEVKVPPPPVKLPHASIGAWWACFWVGNVFGNIAARQAGTGVDALLMRNTLNAISDTIDIVSAVLAIVVVRGVTARLIERFRRARHNPVEALQAAGVTITDLVP